MRATNQHSPIEDRYCIKVGMIRLFTIPVNLPDFEMDKRVGVSARKYYGYARSFGCDAA